MSHVRLRPVEHDDVAIFYRHMCDDESVRMAAFTPKDPTDRDAHDAHWQRVLADDTNVCRSVLLEADVVGHLVAFERDGAPEITYWIDRSHWGKGVATQALTKFLTELTKRPLYARAAADNAASVRVLSKCGFVLHAEERGFAEARGQEIDEVVMVLR